MAEYEFNVKSVDLALGAFLYDFHPFMEFYFINPALHLFHAIPSTIFISSLINLYNL